jgi:hypothetical protein
MSATAKIDRASVQMTISLADMDAISLRLEQLVYVVRMFEKLLQPGDNSFEDRWGAYVVIRQHCDDLEAVREQFCNAVLSVE